MKKLFLLLPILFALSAPFALATNYTADNSLTLNLIKGHTYSGTEILLLCANQSPNSGDDFKGLAWNGPTIAGMSINQVTVNQNLAITLTGTPTQVQSSVLEGGCYQPYRKIDITTNVIDPVPGVCGSSSGKAFTDAPSTNLCDTGTAGAVTKTGINYSWSCTQDIGISCAAGFITPPQQVVTAAGQSTQDNLLSLLLYSIPYVVVAGAAFFAFRYVWKKVKGQSH